MSTPKSTARKESRLTAIGRKIGDATGVGVIARAALAAERTMIAQLVAGARKAGVSEPTIQKALAVKKKQDRALAVAAILYPMIPNPALLRLLAGEHLDDLKETRAKKPAAPRTKGKRGST
jgi:hypothetical protein